MTVLGVYLPCTDMGIECYSERLMELEKVISERQRFGSILITGDFNAHLGTLGGTRGEGSPNQQGILHQPLVRCRLYAVSLSLTEGPRYTFSNSMTQTTVDYMIASHDASDLIRRCFTHKPAPLNCSDHLPISTVLNIPTATITLPHPPTDQRVNWAKALKSNCLIAYQKQVSSIVSPLLGRQYGAQMSSMLKYALFLNSYTLLPL